MYADVSRAYFYAKAVRPVYVKLPEEDIEAGDEGKCGRLRMSMYGTRDAALNCWLEYAATLRAAGYVQGSSNPCLFYNEALGVAVMVHGDDFVAVGPRQHLSQTRKTLEEKYKIKFQELGRGEGQDPELRILNKIVRMTPEGVELEADPRHAEMVIKDLNLQDAKPSTVPGSKEEMKKIVTKDEGKTDNIDSIEPFSKGRIINKSGLLEFDVEGNVDSVQEAKDSMRGEVGELQIRRAQGRQRR